MMKYNYHFARKHFWTWIGITITVFDGPIKNIKIPWPKIPANNPIIQTPKQPPPSGYRET
jgi:hypothetical protein